MRVIIKEVNSSSGISSFIKFQFKHYTNNQYWVPPIVKQEKKYFSKANPILKNADIQLILAVYEGKVVGRAAVMINHLENEANNVKHARFGWLEFINRIDVSKALFKYIEDWAKARDMTAIKGPYGLSNFDKAGLLIEGFDQLSTMITIYNHDFYPKHLDSLGYKKLVDWQEFRAPVPAETPEKVSQLAKVIYDKYELKDLPISNKKEIKEIATPFFQLLEAAYANLEGFIPFAPEQKEYYKKKFLPYVHPKLSKFITDSEGTLIAYGIVMPSYSRALQKANGALFPTGILQIRKANKKNDTADLYLIAVHPDWQNKGITAIIMDDILKGLRETNIKFVESNPELETNTQIHQLFSNYETTIHKRRRAYIKELFILE